MKKVWIGILAVLATLSLVACGMKEEVKPVPNNTVQNQEQTENNTQKEEPKELTEEEMYASLKNDYENALKEFDLEDISGEENIVNKYPFVNINLIMHIARYQEDGAKLTYQYQDIDNNGVKELIVGANNGYGAIYSYDKKTNTPTKIFFQDTLERGDLSIYNNGVILSQGSGGAAIHYYEFGKIASDGISYNLLESIEEEYVEDSDTPIYRDTKTNNTLDYKNLDEIMEKYTKNTTNVPKNQQEGTAGSNIPLKDNHEEAEYQIKVAMQNLLKEAYGDKVFDARLNVEKIYTAEDEAEVAVLKEMNLGPNEVAFEIKYDIKPAQGVDPIVFTAANGDYDEESGWIKNKSNLGILRPTDSGEPKYKITDFGTGW